MTAEDVVSTLEYLFEARGVPEHVRSDNGQSLSPRQSRAGWPAGSAGVEDAVHRAGEPVGERL